MKLTLTPAELIDQLRAWFHPKDRSLYIASNLYVYSQALAWQNAISTFQNLPGLVGFWPMSSIQRSTGNAYDLSGQARTLTYNGNPVYGFSGLAPYIELDGAGDYLSRADETDLDILGTETIYAAPGLTVGGWFRVSSLPGAFATFLSKWTAAGNQRSFQLTVSSTGTLLLSISANGIASVALTTTGTIAANTWCFIVGRFTPSTSQTVFFSTSGNLASETLAAGIPASIFNSTAALVAGGTDAGAANLLTGRASLCFLCANALSDTIINALFQQTRSLFGV